MTSSLSLLAVGVCVYVSVIFKLLHHSILYSHAYIQYIHMLYTVIPTSLYTQSIMKIIILFLSFIYPP